MPPLRSHYPTVRVEAHHLADPSTQQLLDRLATARTNPRLAQPVLVMFRNRKPEEASDEELRAILEEIDALAEENE